VHYSGGRKGGGGKTLVSIALVALLRQEGRQVILVEGDAANSEAYMAYCGSSDVRCEPILLDRQEGWLELVDLIEANAEYDIVVNTGARQEEEVDTTLPFLVECLNSLERTIQVYWAMNRQQDSLNQIGAFADRWPDVPLYAIRNLYFGEPDDFKPFNGDQALITDLRKRGAVVDLAVLAKRVVDRIYNERQPPHVIIEEGVVADRIEMQRWLKRVREALGDAISA
jgi:hypothetical protein